MIITKEKPYEEVKAQLNKDDKVGIVACNMCARICKTGGKDGMERLRKRLEEDGFKVVDTDLIGTPCVFEQLEATQLRGDVTLVLACEGGLHILKKIFPNKKLILALDTIGLGAVDESGEPVLVKAF